MTNPDFNKLYGWQDIESAPRGVEVLLKLDVNGKHIKYHVASYNDELGVFTDWAGETVDEPPVTITSGEVCYTKPTHWRPLPTTKEAEIMQIMWEGLVQVDSYGDTGAASHTLNKVRSKIDE